MFNRVIVLTTVRAAAVALVLVIAACRAQPAPPPAAKPGSPGATQAPSVAAAATLDPEVAATVEKVLSSAQHPGLMWSHIPDVAPALTTIYEGEPDKLVWFTGATPDAMTAPAVAAVNAAGEHGLEASDYDGAPLAEQWKAISAGTASAPERALFDVALSVSAARLLKAVHLGRVDPATMLWGYDVATKPFDLVARFTEMRAGQGLSAMLDELEPPVTHYKRARKALAIYRGLVVAGEPPLVPLVAKGKKFEPGAAWDGVPQLAARLRAFGDLPAGASSDPAGDAPTLSGPVVDALKGFQRRHGLDADGVIGPGTVSALDVSAAARVRQIALSM
ncbi:MAG: peptidoglycan-binding protein, partial [Acidobacteriota bacterium]